MASRKDFEDVKQQGERSRRQLEHDLRELSDTVEKFLKSSAEDSSEQLDELRAEAGSRLENAKARLASYSEEFKTRVHDGKEYLHEHGRDAFECADHYVHENPWRSIGIAAAVGTVFGLLAGRR
ncbi:DUF883 family protein [Carnimonas nigrificans]|uniref:DUF883 family protein n=1 Tax=Carnimonas nigrificans TaxID=64323 RepID=UPI000472DECC|nr:DUF883 family protein [Carnimonas nigrificans]